MDYLLLEFKLENRRITYHTPQKSTLEETSVSAGNVKALLCLNCGSKQFEELPGKRRCAFCGTEFEVEDKVKRLPYFRCMPGHIVSTGTFLGDGTGKLSIYTGPPSDIVIIKQSNPGVPAKDWTRSLNRQWTNKMIVGIES